MDAFPLICSFSPALRSHAFPNPHRAADEEAVGGGLDGDGREAGPHRRGRPAAALVVGAAAASRPAVARSCMRHLVLVQHIMRCLYTTFGIAAAHAAPGTLPTVRHGRHARDHILRPRRAARKRTRAAGLWAHRGPGPWTDKSAAKPAVSICKAGVLRRRRPTSLRRITDIHSY